MAASGAFLPRFDVPTLPSAADWDTFKELIIQRYIHEDKSLDEVQKYLLDTFNFDGTPRMFKRRFTDWGIYKVVREQNAIKIVEEIARYRAIHNRSPPVLKVNGRFVDKEKVRRSLNRHRLRWRRSSSNPDYPDPATLTSASVAVDEDHHESPVSDVSTGGRQSSIRLSPAYEGSMDDADRAKGPMHYPVPALSRKHTEVLGDFIRQELGSLSVAVLQTDYHREKLQLDGYFTGMIKAFTSSPCGFMPSPEPLQEIHAFVSPTLLTLAQSRELSDLESILYLSRNYYDSLASKRNYNPMRLYQCSCKETIQARDFYARYWLGLVLGAGPSTHNMKLAWALYDGVFSQTGAVLKEDHPHFLPWICFVISYPRHWGYQGQEAKDLQAKTLSFAQWMTESVGGRTDPRFLIMQKLNRSRHPRDIALALLRQIVDRFHQLTHGRHVQQLQVLALLLDHINEDQELNETDIEGVLHQWAKTSLSIAELIQKDELARVYHMSMATVAHVTSTTMATASVPPTREHQEVVQ